MKCIQGQYKILVSLNPKNVEVPLVVSEQGRYNKYDAQIFWRQMKLGNRKTNQEPIAVIHKNESFDQNKINREKENLKSNLREDFFKNSPTG